MRSHGAHGIEIEVPVAAVRGVDGISVGVRVASQHRSATGRDYSGPHGDHRSAYVGVVEIPFPEAYLKPVVARVEAEELVTEPSSGRVAYPSRFLVHVLDRCVGLRAGARVLGVSKNFE